MSGKAPFWNTTHWSMIYAAGELQQAEGVDALNRLLETYRQPCIKHLEHGFSIASEMAEDWFHDFVKHKILAHDLISSADPSKGRFRDLLRASLTRYGIDKIRIASKRQHLENPLNEESSEHLIPPCEGQDPFTMQWIKTLLQEAVQITRRHYQKKNRSDHWEAFHEGFFIPKLNGTKAPTRRSLTTKYGFTSESKTNNILLNVTRYFRQSVIGLITRYSQSDKLIEEEWESLQTYLTKASIEEKTSSNH